MLFIFLNFAFSKVHLFLSEEHQFIQWMRENQQFYTGDEYHFRLGIFITNTRYCQDFNRRNGLTFRVGINKFSCYTPSEYKLLLGSHSQYTQTNKLVSTKLNVNVPDSCDWRDKGVVNPIRDQGSCGGCWSFSAITTSESAYAIHTGNLLQFSEQNLIDCAPFSGCGGGWADDACKFIIDKQNGQFNSQSDYPYKAIQDKCLYDASKAIGKITSLITVSIADENDLKEKVALYGVASICIAAGNYPFQSYSGGILDDEDCKGTYLSHAVAAVGYGTENGIDYWIIRNSWGTSWGEDGYVRMIRNKHNLCGIATRAFVAVDTE